MDYQTPATAEAERRLRTISSVAEFVAFRSEFPELCADFSYNRSACFVSVLVTANVPHVDLPDIPSPAYPDALDPGEPSWEHLAVVRLDDETLCDASGFARIDWARTGFRVKSNIYVIPPKDKSSDRFDLVTVGSGTESSWKEEIVAECAAL